MLVLLHELEFAIERYGTDGYDDTHIAGLCLQLRTDIIKVFKDYGSREVADAEFGRYHKRLAGLYDQVFVGGGYSRTVEQAVAGLLKDHEGKYEDLIDPRFPLPRAYADALKAKIDAALPALRDALIGKGVQQVYLDEVQDALDTLFTPAKPPLLAYQHMIFLPCWLETVQQLAYDPRPDDNWPHRFLLAMVYTNFNHMGFLISWIGDCDRTLAEAGSDADRLKALTDWQRGHALLSEQPTTGYDPVNLSLKKHMGIYLESLYNQLLPPTATGGMVLPTPLRTNLGAGDHVIRFLTLHKAGEYDYETQREAAVGYSAVNVTKDGKELLPESLTKHDKSALFNPARRWYKTVWAIVKNLEETYKFERPK